MAELDEKKLAEENGEDSDEMLVLTLTDEESGEEKDYVVLAQAELDSKLYYCVMTHEAYLKDEEDEEGYGLLRVTEDGDDVVLETIDDDEEYDKVAEYFDDLLFNEEDYDN